MIRAGQFACVGQDKALSVGEGRGEESAKRFTRVMPAPQRLPTADDSPRECFPSPGRLLPHGASERYERARHRLRFCLRRSPRHTTRSGEIEDRWAFRRLGLFGHALQLENSNYALIPNLPGTDAQQLSFSAWVYCWDRHNWEVIACEHNVATRTLKAWDGFDNWQFHVGLYEFNGDLVVSVNQRDKTRVALREGVSQPFPIGRWQHVAFVADGSTLHLYRNGRQVASARATASVRFQWSGS